MNEELYFTDDNTLTSFDNIDNVTDDSTEDFETIEEADTSEVEVSTQTEQLLDFTSLLQDTNTYLSCLIILQVVFICLYCFGFLRQCFERLVNK